MNFFVHGGYSDPLDHIEIAKLADVMGIDGLVVPDHVFLPLDRKEPYPHSPDGKLPFPIDTNWPDPWVLVGAFSSVTSNIRFLSTIYIMALRNPLFVAKSVGTAAVLTKGRVTLGVGVGWMREEFDALGSDFSRRGRITDRSIEIVRRLWRDGSIEAYRDEFFDFPALIMRPQPEFPVPILIGGSSEAAYERATRIGDGYNAPVMTTDEMIPLVKDLHERLKRHDRDPKQFEIRVGGAREGFDDVARLAEAGVSGINARIWPSSERDLSVKLRAIEQFVSEVVEPIRARFE